MGWAFRVEADGREIGYSVAATCDEDGCNAAIDRGLAYACGGNHGGGADYCDRYFCGEHLFFPGSKCRECAGDSDEDGDV